MPRFVAVHPVGFSEEQLGPLAKEPLPDGVTWNITYSAFAENRSFCHWEAPTKEVVAEVFKMYEIPYEAIHEVRRFDPTTGEMEPVPVDVKILQPATTSTV